MTRFAFVCLLMAWAAAPAAQQPLLNFGHKVFNPEKTPVKFYHLPDGGAWVSLLTPDSAVRYFIAPGGTTQNRFVQHAVQNNPDSTAGAGRINTGILDFLCSNYINGYIYKDKMVELYSQHRNDLVVYETGLKGGESRIAASVQFAEKETLFTQFVTGDTFYLVSHLQKSNKVRIYYYVPGMNGFGYREKEINDPLLMVVNVGFLTRSSSFSNFLKQDFQVFNEADGPAFPASYMPGKKVFIQKDGNMRFIFKDMPDSTAVFTLNIHDFSHRVSVFHWRRDLKKENLKLQYAAPNNSCIAGNMLTKYFVFRKQGWYMFMLAHARLDDDAVYYSGLYGSRDTSVINGQAIRKFMYTRRSRDREIEKTTGDWFAQMHDRRGFIITSMDPDSTIHFTVGCMGTVASTGNIIASVVMTGLLTWGINALPNTVGYGYAIITQPNGYELSFEGRTKAGSADIIPEAAHSRVALLPLIDFLNGGPFRKKLIAGTFGAQGSSLFTVYNEQLNCFQLYQFPF